MSNNNNIVCPLDPHLRNKVDACRELHRKSNYRPWCKKCKNFNDKKPFTRKRGVRNGM